MFENVIDEAAIENLDNDTINQILSILEKAGY
jgi:hypothetical protein